MPESLASSSASGLDCIRSDAAGCLFAATGPVWRARERRAREDEEHEMEGEKKKERSGRQRRSEDVACRFKERKQHDG
eukprot:38119-Rhodomonas_salina.1